ncbi:MAG: hypothetical protein Q4G25_09915 [Paracoccus sp. (in: a-proteobacteria)]|nr:hypothetical protein [Paracoccus sp. (in: a-proteobacteria)]
MPHPHALIKRVNSLEDAQGHLSGVKGTNSDKSISWTILKFDSHPEYFVFHSTRDLGQKSYADADESIAKAERPPGKNDPGRQAALDRINHRRVAVADQADRLAEQHREAPFKLDTMPWHEIPDHKAWVDTRDEVAGHHNVPWGGHAEEHMLQYFAELQRKEGKASEKVTIWNADTPCMPGDKNCSKNLSGFPDSCCSKLDHLAEAYADLKITVKVGRSLSRGHTQGMPLGKAVGALNNREEQEKPDNLTYTTFDDDERSVLLPGSG